MSRDRELPWPPPKRQANFVVQFSECLFFTEQNNGTISQWGAEPQLKRNMTNLVSQYPDYGQVDWLTYFVNSVISETAPPTAQKLALRHLFCFYQVDFYYLARRWWFKTKAPQGVYAWTDLFDVIALPFVELTKAQSALRDFDPTYTTRSYVGRICYRVGRDWLRQKFGIHFEDQLGAVKAFEGAGSDSEQPKEQAEQHKLEKIAIKEQETQDEITRYKQEQHRVWQIISKSLKHLKKLHQEHRLKVLSPSQLTLWDVMAIGYGLNIGQSGVDAILTDNQQRVTQSTISRRLKSLKMDLFLDCLGEFSKEIAEEFGDRLPNNETHPDFQNIAKKQHKKLDPLLRIYYQDWIYATLLQPSLTDVKIEDLPSELIPVLNHWFKEQLNLVFTPGCLTPGMLKKMQIVLDLWEQKMRQERG